MAPRKRTVSVGESEVVMSQMRDSDMSINAATAEPVSLEAPRKRKSKKKKYSRALGSGQKVEVAVSRGAHRLANAVNDALSTWRKERDRSSRNKRDGAIRDAMQNTGRALSKFGREAARIPEDITDAWPKLSKMFRR